MGLLLQIFVLLLVLVIVYFIYSSHIFTPVEVTVETFDDLNVACVPFQGPYSKAYLQNVRIEDTLNELSKGIDFKKQPCFGIYYDSPKAVEESKLRSVVGKILPEGTIQEKDIEELSKKGIKVTKLKLSRCASIHYPFNNLISLMCGMSRAYPALHKWCNENPSSGACETNPFVELYGYVDGKVSFLALLDKRDAEDDIIAQYPN